MLNPLGPRQGGDYPPLVQANYSAVDWGLVDSYQCRGNGSSLPHAIVSTVSGVYASGADRGLTLHEVQAIASLMVIRLTSERFKNRPIHPVRG